MELQTALAALAALSQETRLTLFRHLVTLGPAGTPAGALAARFDLPPATLSFHLKALSDAELAIGTRQGRQIRYAANFATMNALVAFITEDCCGGARCAPAQSSSPKKRKAS